MVARIPGARRAAMFGRRGGAAAPPAVLPFSDVTVQPDGFTITATIADAKDGGTWSGLNDPSSPGFAISITSTCGDTTRVRTGYLTTVRRKPYSDHAVLEETENGSNLEVEFASSTCIFDGDVATGSIAAGFYTDDGTGGSDAACSLQVPEITNNSAVDYRKPQVIVLNPDHDHVIDETYTVKVAIDHPYGRQGSMVRKAVIRITDGTTTLTSSQTTMTGETMDLSGLFACYYAAPFDMTQLDNGLCTIHVAVHPWVGDTYDTETDGFGTSSPLSGGRVVYNDQGNVDYPLTYAAVNLSTGDNGTGVVSTTQATAEAAKFATLPGAAAALKSAIVGHTSGGIILLDDGTYVHATFSASNTDEVPLVIRAGTGASRDNIDYRDAAAHVFNGTPARLRLQSITLNAVNSKALIDHAAADTPGVGTLILEDVALTGTANFSMFTRVGLIQAYNVNGNSKNWFGGSDYGVCALQMGCINMHGSAGPASLVYNAIACDNPNVGGTQVGSNSINSDVPLQKSGLWQNNIFRETATGVTFHSNIFQIADGQGIGFTYNLIETYTGTFVAFQMAGEAATANFTCSGHAWGLSILGNRTIFNYANQDAFTKHPMYMGACVHYKYDIKGDVHAGVSLSDPSAGTYLGNQFARHAVDTAPSLFIAGDAAGGTTPSAASWLGEALGDGKNEFPVGTLGTGDADFVDDQSGAGGSGSGDYTPGASTDIPQISGEHVKLRHDLFGTEIPLDDTAYAGVVQVAA